MASKISTLSERLVANSAIIWALSCVFAEMVTQIAAFVKNTGTTRVSAQKVQLCAVLNRVLDLDCLVPVAGKAFEGFAWFHSGHLDTLAVATEVQLFRINEWRNFTLQLHFFIVWFSNFFLIVWQEFHEIFLTVFNKSVMMVAFFFRREIECAVRVVTLVQAFFQEHVLVRLGHLMLKAKLGRYRHASIGLGVSDLGLVFAVFIEA